MGLVVVVWVVKDSFLGWVSAGVGVVAEVFVVVAAGVEVAGVFAVVGVAVEAVDKASDSDSDSEVVVVYF